MNEGGVIPVVRLRVVDSTNLEARRRIEGAARAFWVVAETQTAGRGQRGRGWSSPAGGLWATLAWPSAASPGGVLDGLGGRIGVALRDAVGTFCAAAEVKAPNDVLIEGRKVAGVLTEVVDGWVLVGCGVNVRNEAPELEAPAIATSLREWVDPAPGLDAVLRELDVRLRGALLSSGGSVSG